MRRLAVLGGHQPSKLLLPAVKGLLADARLAGDLAQGCPLLVLQQGKGDLLVSKPGPFHGE